MRIGAIPLELTVALGAATGFGAITAASIIDSKDDKEDNLALIRAGGTFAVSMGLLGAGAFMKSNHWAGNVSALGLGAAIGAWAGGGLFH